MRLNKRSKTGVVYAMLYAGTLMLSGAHVALADGGGEESNKGMQPNEGIGKSIDSGHMPNEKNLKTNASKKHQQHMSEKSAPDGNNSNKGMNPNDKGMKMSVDSSSMSTEEKQSKNPKK